MPIQTTPGESANLKSCVSQVCLCMCVHQLLGSCPTCISLPHFLVEAALFVGNDNPTHTHTHTHTHACTRTHTHTDIHTRTYTHTIARQTYTHAHTRTHARTHTHTHTHRQTHTHTHTMREVRSSAQRMHGSDRQNSLSGQHQSKVMEATPFWTDREGDSAYKSAWSITDMPSPH